MTTEYIINDSLISYAFAKKHQVLCDTVSETGTVILLYTQTLSPEILSEIRRISSLSIKLTPITESTFMTLLTEAYQINHHHELISTLSDSLDLNQMLHDLPETQDLLAQEDDAPIIRLINGILSEAIRSEASDLHIETFEHHIVIRIRTDGILKEILRLERSLAPLIVSRIKVMARLDIAEKRLPQDGRLSLNLGNRFIDVRVATMPSNYGERVVLRILDKENNRLQLKELGLPTGSLESMQKLIRSPHGIILITGPTGSGKTTTLYALLSELNSVERNIMTIEDPVEYDLPGISQTHINPKIGMSFAKGLRAILRQDPDVVMIGEIRDLETAEIAIQASLTGHLVLSTLHTNTAIGAITRLQDMGIPPFLLSSSLLGVVAQRLVRKLCIHCRKAAPINKAFSKIMQLKTPGQHYEAATCQACQFTGYKGRTALYEIILIDTAMQRLINQSASEADYEKAVRAKSEPLQQHGFNLVLAGITSIDEVLRVSHERL